jgi:hypothetical protein
MTPAGIARKIEKLEAARKDNRIQIIVLDHPTDAEIEAAEKANPDGHVIIIMDDVDAKL